jgi:hypothetical protein
MGYGTQCHILWMNLRAENGRCLANKFIFVAYECEAKIHEKSRAYRIRIRKIFLIFSMYVLHSTLLHLPPLRFHCVGGCWDRTQDSCDCGIGCQTL